MYKQETENLNALGSLLLLITCCDSVDQALQIVRLLSWQPHPMFKVPTVISTAKMSEIMFSLATFFYMLWVKGKLLQRYHYYTYYSAVNVKQTQLLGSPSPAIKPTNEQRSIIDHDYYPGETVKVIALAGTGKTATLVELARKYPEKKFLYCVYNKSVQHHAESVVFKNIPNVVCKTFHSLAFTECDFDYLKKVCDEIRPYILSKLIGLPSGSTGNHRTFVKLVYKTLISFITSRDKKILVGHIPVRKPNESVRVFSDAVIIREANRIWAKMSDPEDFEIKISHDGYVKCFQLAESKIKVKIDSEMNSNTKEDFDFDMLLADEAQDLTPAICDILERELCAKVFVGDPHQSIYSFRGADNIFSDMQADCTFYLTKSFRFGPEIAYVGSLLLSGLKGERRQTLVGTLNRDDIQANWSYDRPYPVAIIARKNATLFDMMVKMLEKAPPQKKFGLDFDFDILLDIYNLLIQNKQAIKKKLFVKYFDSIQDLRAYAKVWEDIQLLSKIAIVKKYCESESHNLPDLIDRIKARKSRPFLKADIIFSTLHKSKGLEFDNVVVTNDFLPHIVDEEAILSSISLGDIRKEEEDELNMIYVAATRAKKCLYMPPLMLHLLELANEPFIFPTCGGSSSQQSLSCVRCNSVITSAAILNRDKFKLVGMGKDGLVCNTCVSRYNLPNWSKN